MVLPDEAKNEIKKELSDINDVDLYLNDLLDVLKRYLPSEKPENDNPEAE